jgi:hypothetical protein
VVSIWNARSGGATSAAFPSSILGSSIAGSDARQCMEKVCPMVQVGKH